MPVPSLSSLPGIEASFNPSAAVPEIPGTGGLLATEQKTRPPRLFYRLVLRCECGLRLTGVEYWFFPDTIHIRGVCLECGIQDAIFAPPNIHCEEGFQQRTGITAEEMVEAIHEVMCKRLNADVNSLEEGK